MSLTPLLLPAVCLILGIVSASQVESAGVMLALMGASVVVAWLTARWPRIQTLCILSAFFFLGAWVARPKEKPQVEGQMVTGVIFSEPAEKPKTIAVDVLLPEQGNDYVRCYLWKDERSRQVVLGSPVMLSKAEGGFVRSSEWQLGGDGYRKLSSLQRVRLRFLHLRHHLLEGFRQHEVDERQYAVLAAMTLGDKSALTKELREIYSVTGASHVLALSGLHLGIIYLLLSYLTLRRRHFWLSQTVIILCIWAFALLTGLSTSVIRSATMISIYALFSVAGRHHSPVNLLCFTAIVMLLVSPSSLWDVGFQLSFAAVLSILLWMPLFESMLPERYRVGHRLVRYIYNMVGVSVAAQIGVAPLIAYHFGRFSTWFLLTNFIVIPAAIIILYGALLVLVVPALTPVLLWMVDILNKALGWISQMPCSSIDGLHPSVLQVCIIYASFFALWLAGRRVWRVPPVT